MRPSGSGDGEDRRRTRSVSMPSESPQRSDEARRKERRQNKQGETRLPHAASRLLRTLAPRLLWLLLSGEQAVTNSRRRVRTGGVGRTNETSELTRTGPADQRQTQPFYYRTEKHRTESRGVAANHNGLWTRLAALPWKTAVDGGSNPPGTIQLCHTLSPRHRTRGTAHETRVAERRVMAAGRRRSGVSSTTTPP